MGGIASWYADSINDELRYYPTWQPNVTIKLGDYGDIKDDLFQKLGNIRNLGVEFTAILGQTADDMEYTSNGTSILAINAGTQGFINAGLKYVSTKERGLHFSSKRCYLNQVEEVGDLLDKARAKFQELGKDIDYIVIEVLHAETTAVILSNKKNAEFSIEAALPTASFYDFHDISGSFSIKSNKNIGYKMVDGKALTPLFQN